MPIIDCTCKGVNPDCIKCFGRGYYDSDTINEIVKINIPNKVNIGNINVAIPFDEMIKSLPAHKIKRLIAHFEKEIKWEIKHYRICKNKKIKNEIEQRKDQLMINYNILKVYANSIGVN